MVMILVSSIFLIGVVLFCFGSYQNYMHGSFSPRYLFITFSGVGILVACVLLAPKETGIIIEGLNTSCNGCLENGRTHH